MPSREIEALDEFAAIAGLLTRFKSTLIEYSDYRFVKLSVPPVWRMPAYVDDRDSIEKSVDQKEGFGQLPQPRQIVYYRKNPCDQ